MYKKIIIVAAIFISVTSFSVYTQNISDALRYSYLTPGGTARFMSMGGSFGALGGDFSTLSINPAGIGVYRSSEITFTPSLYHNTVNSEYYGTTADDFQYNFNMHNLGGVFNFSVPGDEDKPGWRSVNLGIGFNRHNNFNMRRVTEGVNPDNSMLTAWLDQAINEEGANPANFDPFSTWLAWDTYLIDSTDTAPYLMVDPESGGLQTRQESNVSGSVRDFVLTMGANYNDRLYLGGTFGFPSVSYSETTTHYETDVQDTIQFLNSFSYKHNLTTTGAGFNFKFGAIFRATDMIRLGAAIHTPTFYELNDRWNAEVNSDITFIEGDRHKLNSKSKEGRFDYEINTPLKAIGSLGLIFGTNGLINIDYEYIDYSNTRLRSDNYSFTKENIEISDDLTAQHVIRAGGEIIFHPFVLRAGYAYYTNPYESGINNTERSLFSAGFGIRENNYSIDFAYMFKMQDEEYYPYGASYTDPISNEYNKNAFMVTLGLRF